MEERGQGGPQSFNFFTSRERKLEGPNGGKGGGSVGGGNLSPKSGIQGERLVTAGTKMRKILTRKRERSTRRERNRKDYSKIKDQG